jgi:hypothetical protein
MKIFQLLILITIFISAIIYLRLTKNIFLFCKNKNELNHINNSLDEACNSFKYRDHTWIKYLLNIIYEDFTENVENELKEWIMKNNAHTVKNTTKITKFIHLSLYIFSLYILFRILPNKILQLLIYFANKLFFIISLILTIEAILYVYYDIQIDILYTINYLNSWLF